MKSRVIRHGMRVRPWWKPKDHRNYSFHRTFGAASPNLLDQLISYDAGLTMPDQNADGLPFGCTGYTTAEIATDADNFATKLGIIYWPRFTYEKTCAMEGHDDTQGCDIQTALKSATVYGLQELIEHADAEALAHRRGQRFEVDLAPGYDWFDSIRSALIRNPGRSISIGTPWLIEWERVGPDGLLPSTFVYDGNANEYSWHNHKIFGIGYLNGEWVLLDKSWQGKNVGDKGIVKFDRETINRVMTIRGTEAFTQAKANPDDVYAIKLDLFSTILSYCMLWIAALQKVKAGWYGQ